MSDLELETGSFTLILSARKSGKSFLVRELIYHFLTNANNRCQYLYMFSNTAKFESSGTYSFIDPSAIFKANPENVEKIVEQLFQIQLDTKKKNNILLIFDDIDLSARYQQSIEKLAQMGRHFNITTVLSAQISTGTISPLIRDNITYLFFRELNREVIKKNIYSMITTNDFENTKQFLDFVFTNTKEYQFIYYAKGCVNKEIRIVKASEIPEDFKYKVASPVKKEAEEKPKQPAGYGPAMRIQYFNSEGFPYKRNM